MSRDVAEAAFDFVSKISEAVHHRDRQMRRLQDLKTRSEDRCGNCTKWMKSSQCPREKNVGGMSRGPSMSGMACREFVANASATKAREELLSWSETGYQ